MSKLILLGNLIVLLASSSAFAATSTVRDELDRYMILRDRQILEREFRETPHLSFFKIDLAISSGTKTLIGDIKDSTSGSSSTVAKTTEVFNILSKQLNTERYIDVDLELGVPLPYFKLWGLKFLPSIFYNLNLGSSISISNFGDATNPRAQVYIKKEKKMGAASLIQLKENETLRVGLYSLTRSDSSNTVTALQIVNDEDLIDFDTLNETHTMYSADVSYQAHYDKFLYLLETKELQLWSASATKKSFYGTRPLIHGRIGREHSWKKGKVSSYLGLHYRKRYPLHQGLYYGLEMKNFTFLPITLHAKINAQFLSVNPVLVTKYFHFSYSYKTPHQNPQKDMWVPAMHSILINASFPY